MERSKKEKWKNQMEKWFVKNKIYSRLENRGLFLFNSLNYKF